MRSGDVAALARLLTLVEQGSEQAVSVLEAINACTGKAYVVGITGPPGAGKSTLVDQLTTLLRKGRERVGILAVDPSSPFTGGAFLGDRVRLQRHYLDREVFIRSMATRGATGGLSHMAGSVVRVLDAWGAGIILVETVGVGQTELEIMNTADTVVMVLSPESGDAIQALKAGLLEVVDVFVVNKADREGADRMATTLKSTMNLAESPTGWRPPVLLTQAHIGEGVDGIEEAIKNHREALTASSLLSVKRSERQRREFAGVFKAGVDEHLNNKGPQEGRFADLLSQVAKGEVDPFVAAWRLLREGQPFREWKEEP